MVAPERPACPGARPGAHFATRADTFRAVMAWNGKRIGDLSMAWSLLHHRHAMGPLRPHSTPGTHEPDTLRARLRRLEQENARLLDRERTRLEETRALAGIGRLLSERLEPDVVGLRIAESLRSLLAGGSAVVYRLDPDSQSLHALAVSHATDPSGGWRPVREPGSGAVGLAIRERRTITTPDALADPRIETSADLRRHLEQAPDRAILAVPLLTQDRLIGVLAVRNATGSVFGMRVPGSDAVRLRYWTAAWYDTLADTCIEPGQGLGGLVLVERRPMRTSDYLRDPRIGDHYQQRIRRLGIHAQMAVPVLIEDRVEGLL